MIKSRISLTNHNFISCIRSNLNIEYVTKPYFGNFLINFLDIK